MNTYTVLRNGLLGFAMTITTMVQAQDIFIYSPNERQGLHVATQQADGTWHDIGQLCASDYAQWGSEKRMYDPHVLRAHDGTWRAVWAVNNTAPTFAAAYSKDLVTWRPQDYPRLSQRGCSSPTITEETDGTFRITYVSNNTNRCCKASADFRHFSNEQPCDAATKSETSELEVDGKQHKGQKFTLNEAEFAKLTNHMDKLSADAKLWRETLLDDSTKLLPNLNLNNGMAVAKLNISDNKKSISDKLIGIFFEDISYAADGGLYAEMVQNRDFEYNGEGRVRKGEKPWNATTAWSSKDEIEIATENPLSEENPHYVILKKASITNSGWDGMALEEGKENYIVSLWARCNGCKSKTITFSLKDGEKEIGASSIKISGNKWKCYTTTMTCKAKAAKATLTVTPQDAKGEIHADIISLFPKETFKGRRNGLRKDLAEAIAALKPRFVRFPGGCMSHGQGIDNIYHWQETVGPLHKRKPDFNIWNYHQTRGLGFFEFFQWCEDMGAEPLPVLAAGVPCQNSVADASGMGGQQGGIPMEQMEDYCQEFLNLIEWANGDPKNSPLAKLRADAGHPEPFNLKYVGVGNEDLISTTFEERMIMIAKAIKAKYPEIVICGTVGPFHDPSSDYIEGWEFAKANHQNIDMVDEHYYESPGWYLNNQNYYDNYDRNAPKVYLGEYSCQTRGKKSTVEAALCEAMHLCNVERNGDVVSMTSYAPLLCNTLHGNWNPDMIYFRGGEAPTLTPSYYTQLLFGTHSGTTYTAATLDAEANIQHRVATSIVSNSDGRTFLRVVNLLPTPLCLNIGKALANKHLRAKGFAGRPTDRSVKLEDKEFATSNDGDLVAPAYSFFIIEL